jgi:hypothetical protein
MPPKKKADFVDWRDDWRNCRAKKLLVQDLAHGRIPLSANEMRAEVAHRQRPEYEEVDFEKFKRNFESLRKSISQQKAQATRDSEGLTRDRQRRAAAAAAAAAPAAAAAAGETQPAAWHRSDAQMQLRSDMQQNLHISMKKKDLWQSQPNYEQFDLRTFRNHIYKEEIRQKRLAKYQRDHEQREKEHNDDSDAV